jgi:hemerythrin-like domain-containing protein
LGGDLKRIEELRALSDDHHTALVLARRCQQAAQDKPPLSIESVWKSVLSAFANHLEPHFRIEENYLLPALDDIQEFDLTARIRDDHARLRALRDATPVTQDLIEEFGRALELHVRFEEREVFEHTQDRLSSAALRAISEACESPPRPFSVPPLT